MAASEFQPQLVDIVDDGLGRIVYEDWHDKNSMSAHLGQLAKKLGKEILKPYTDLMFLNIQYLPGGLSAIETPERILEKKLILPPIFSHDIFDKYLGRYYDYIRLHEVQRWHLCSLIMVTRHSKPICFRLCLRELKKSPQDYINIPTALLNTLGDLPPESTPTECVKMYVEKKDIALEEQLRDIRKQIVNIWPEYKETCQEGENDVVLFKQLFGSLNLTLRALNDPLFSKSAYIKVVFYPIIFTWESEKRVVAVIVAVVNRPGSLVNNLIDPPKIDVFAEELTYFIHSVQYRDLLFKECYEKEREFEKIRSFLLREVEKTYKEKKDELQSRWRQQSGSAAPDIESVRDQIQQDNEEKLGNDREALINDIRSAKTVPQICQVAARVCTWKK